MFKPGRQARRSVSLTLIFLLGGIWEVRAQSSYNSGRVVVLGDSLGAGFQNFSLFDDAGNPLGPGGQRYGFGALMAKQVNFDLQLPFIQWPGLPAALGNPVGTPPGTREPSTIGTQTLNLSVPGYLVADVVSRTVDVAGLQNGTNTNGIDAMAVEVLGFPSLLTFPSTCGVIPLLGGHTVLSAVTCAAQLQPNTIVVSAGNNDALQALTQGLPPTNALVFALQYKALLATLKATGATIVVGNIPDVTSLPYLIRSGSCVTSTNYVVPNLANMPADMTNICANPANYEVRPVALVNQAQQAVNSYNQVIATTASAFGIAVADVNGLFRNLSANGVNIDGKHLTTAYGGGLFSLDGIHPTNTGYAILANEYIKAMNSQLNTNLPNVDVATIAENDPFLKSIPSSTTQTASPVVP
jgi:lysophospholipase L1-like esterase